MAFYRDLFTGELKERPSSPDGREVLYVEEIPLSMQQKRTGSVWGRPWVSESLGLANPDQVGQFNEAAKKYAGSGVGYDRQGRLVCESRAARNRALRWLGKVDFDGGYGDHTSTKRAA